MSIRTSLHIPRHASCTRSLCRRYQSTLRSYLTIDVPTPTPLPKPDKTLERIRMKKKVLPTERKVAHPNQPTDANEYALLISKYAQSQEPAKIEECLNSMTMKNIDMNTAALNALMDSYLVLRNFVLLEKYISSIDNGRYRHIPDRETFSIIFRHLIEQERPLHKIIYYLDLMTSKQLVPTDVSISDLLRQLPFEDGLKVMIKLCAGEKIQLSPYFDVLMGGFFTREQTNDQLFRLMELLIEAGVDWTENNNSDVWTRLHEMINAIDEIVILEWLKHNPKHSQKFSNLILSSHASYENTARMKKWHREMLNRRLVTDIQTHNTYLNMLKRQKSTFLVDWFEALQLDSVKPNSDTYTIMFKALMENQDMERIKQVLCHMSNDGVKLGSSLTQNLMIMIWENQEKLTQKNSLTKMLKQAAGGHVSTSLFNKLMKRIVEKSKNAGKFFDSAEQLDVKPDADTYRMLAEFCDAREDPKGVYQALDQLIQTQKSASWHAMTMVKEWMQKDPEEKEKWNLLLKTIQDHYQTTQKSTIW